MLGGTSRQQSSPPVVESASAPNWRRSRTGRWTVTRWPNLRAPPMWCCWTRRPGCGACFRTSLRVADEMLVPLRPGVFDIFAAAHSLDELARHRKASGCRWASWAWVDARHRRRQAARVWPDGLPTPVLGYIPPQELHPPGGARTTLFDVADASSGTWSSGGAYAGWTPEARARCYVAG